MLELTKICCMNNKKTELNRSRSPQLWIFHSNGNRIRKSIGETT